jgi:demethylmenaquinone methyltransferase / 2-methoxy-6-polyprenyl-1,4-benzoquinol methylase
VAAVTVRSPDAQETEARIKSMFDRIAGRYDLLNSIMSARMHHRWRSRTVDLSDPPRGGSALDVCCGTGDLALELKRRMGPDSEVIGIDFSQQMLELARQKSQREALDVSYEAGNALELPFPEASFDVATVGFGIRNLVDLERGITEMARVVRPDGRVAVLEITTPRRPPLSWFYSVWFFRVVPLLGVLARDRSAYSYLPDSVRRFPPAPELAKLMEAVGLRAVRYRLLAGGIVAIHVGTVAGRNSLSKGETS